MLSTLLVSLREFLEVFLIIGVFLGISRKMSLKKEREIILASIVGIAISLFLPVIVFTLGDKAHLIFNERSADMIGGYLMIFSGCFIAYVVFSLHNFFVLHRSKLIIDIHQKMQQNIFDLSLFLTIIFFILREGFEIALFTATTALFSSFMENLAGLALGFVISSVLGVGTYFAYIKFPISKIFKYTEYAIVLLGAAFVANGISELMEVYMDKGLDDFMAIPLRFLPGTSTYAGHLLNNMTGLEQNFSLIKLAIMATYASVIYLLFIRKKTANS